MSNAEQAQYILSLPINEFRAIKKAMATLKRAGMHTEEALHHLVRAHQAAKQAKLDSMR